MTSAGDLPFVSIIVPVLNGEQTIADCLRSLESTSYPKQRREVIVVDNGSTDRTAEIARSHRVRLVTEPRRGLSRARNRGVEASAGEVLAFTDSDCRVSTGWLSHLTAELKLGRADAVAGEVVPYPPSTPAERYAARRKPERSAWQDEMPFPWFNFMNVAIGRDVFERVGRFDTSFPNSCEDIDFSWRFERERLRLVRRPDAVVFHRLRATPGALFRQAHRDGWAWAVLVGKYPEVVPWDWSDEARAWSDLGRSAWRAARTYAIGNTDSAQVTDRHYLRFDFVRKLGQRLGLAGGLLRAAVPNAAQARRSVAGRSSGD